MSELERDEDLPEEKLEADVPSAELAELSAEAKDHLVPKERDWDALEAKLLARMDAFDADEAPAGEDLDAAPSPELAEITRESKEHLVPRERDWSAIERKLVARTEPRKKPMPIQWRGVVAMTAIAAAAAAVFVAGHKSQLSWDPPHEVAANAGVLGTNDGHVVIGGRTVSQGEKIHVGDRIEIGSGRAVFDQAGKVTWALEAQSRARITRTEGGLVLALEQGATEAQVTPVPNGEAFAVDIADAQGHVARVAVHGTHLRVARSGDHVTVDLTEGSVIVGRAPRAGAMLGMLVTAPAHVELDVSDPDRARVDHERETVRPAAVLASNNDLPTIVAKKEIQAPVALNEPEIKPEPKPIAHPNTSPVVQMQPNDLTPEVPQDADPETRIRTAAKSCFARGVVQHDGLEIKTSVSTVLTISIGANSQANTATYYPALPPSVQVCIGDAAIWRKPFSQPNTTLHIKLDLSR